MSERIEELIAKFNGGVKYAAMLADHPSWTDDECVAFAKKWHEVAIKQLSEAIKQAGSVEKFWKLNGLGGWSNGIPYGRNLPTKEMIAEAQR